MSRTWHSCVGITYFSAAGFGFDSLKSNQWTSVCSFDTSKYINVDAAIVSNIVGVCGATECECKVLMRLFTSLN